MPHIYGHGVTEAEVEHILRHPGDDRAGREGTRPALGQTAAGRYLYVIYVPDEEGDDNFVVTAYEIRGKAGRKNNFDKFVTLQPFSVIGPRGESRWPLSRRS